MNKKAGTLPWVFSLRGLVRAIGAQRLPGSRLCALAFAGFLCAADAAPAPTAPGDRILQQELKQEQIRVTTQRVATQLESVIAEFQRNAIAGEDVEMLRAIRSILGKLSEKEMQLVVQYLQKSRQGGDALSSTQQATEAYGLQQVILVQLKQLVLEYQRQQELYELSLRFKELARRQSENMWLGVSLAKTAEGKTSYRSLDESQRISLQLQQSQQSPLKEETALVMNRLEKLAKEIGDGSTGERAQAASKQAREGGMVPALQASIDELKNENFKLLSAIGNEKKARDQMREVSRLLTLAQDPSQALRQALHELDRLIDQQKKVRDDTQKIETRRDADNRAIDQAQVVDNTDLIRRDVDNLAPVAAEELKKATGQMQDARTSLGSNDEQKKRREQALPRQDEALNTLNQARQSLADQLAKLEEERVRPEDAVADLRELREELRELIQKEEKLKEETAAADRKDLPAKAPQQGELKDKAQQIQARAAQQSPAAAQSLGEAASQMDKAQSSLAKAQNNPPAQQAAIDALQKAEQQLGQDIARLEQAEKDLAALEDLLRKLEPIIADQQKLHLDTAKEAVKPEPVPAPNLATKQEQLGRQTGELQQEASSPAPAAAKHLGAAQQNMTEAESQLEKPAPKAAQAEQTEALADLYAAKREIEKKADELRDMLGQPPADGMQALDDVLKAIEQAQHETSQAQSNLQQAPPGLMDSLEQQQQQIADALGGLRQDQPDQAQAAQTAQAQQAANQAAQQLGQKNLRSAIDSMKKAQGAMQQAMQGQPQGQRPEGAQQGDAPTLPDLAQQQDDVRKTAEALLAAQQRAPASAMKQASKLMQQAEQRIAPLAAGEMGQLPQAAEQALETAEQALAKGSAEADAGQHQPAQQSAGAAAQALAQAQAALSLAQAGMSSQMGQPGQGQQPGQGRQPGQARARGQPGQGMNRGVPDPQGDGRRGNWAGAGGANGARNATTGSSGFTGLPKRDRAAILQSQSEKYPQEYGPLVEQYLKNLADQTGNGNGNGSGDGN